MKQRLYNDLVPWYRLLDPPGDHRAEVELFADLLKQAVQGDDDSLLELGSGAGHNGSFLKRHFQCTLTDISPAMLQLSRELNPECAHIEGDMRTLRLERTFDLVLIHDAIVYMCSQDDLRKAIATAFQHLRPGGAAIFAPDCVQDTFREFTEYHETDRENRGLRGVAWVRFADEPNCYCVDYALLLRDEFDVEAVHERHVEGLFSIKAWKQLIVDAGFDVEVEPRALDETEDHGYFEAVFLCRKPK